MDEWTSDGCQVVLCAVVCTLLAQTLDHSSDSDKWLQRRRRSDMSLERASHRDVAPLDGWQS